MDEIDEVREVVKVIVVGNASNVESALDGTN